MRKYFVNVDGNLICPDDVHIVKSADIRDGYGKVVGNSAFVYLTNGRDAFKVDLTVEQVLEILNGRDNA